MENFPVNVQNTLISITIDYFTKEYCYWNESQNMESDSNTISLTDIQESDSNKHVHLRGVRIDAMDKIKDKSSTESWYEMSNIHKQNSNDTLTTIFESCTSLDAKTIPSTEDKNSVTFSLTDTESSLSNVPHSRSGQPGYVASTPFHAALMSGDKGFMNDLLDQVTDDGLRSFIATAPIDYNTEYTAFSRSLYELVMQDWPDEQRDTITKLLSQETSVKHPLKFFEIELPIHLAILSGDYEIIKILLHHGASIFQQDSKGNALLHTLAYQAKDCPFKAAGIFQCLIQDMKDPESERKLAFIENKMGENALDLAARVGSFEFTQLLLRWDNVYRFLVKDKGSLKHYLYDVTDYQKDGGTKMHILQHAVLINDDCLPRLKACDYLTSEPIQTWSNAIQRTNAMAIAFWIGEWCVFFAVYLASIIMYFSSNGQYKNMILSMILIFMSLRTIAFQIFYWITDRKTWRLLFKTIWKRGFTVAFTPYHTIIQFLLGIFANPVLHRFSYAP